MKRISLSRKTTKEVFPFLGIGLTVFFLSIASILSSLFDYYRWQYSIVSDLLYKLYSISIILAFIALAFFFEYCFYFRSERKKPIFIVQT